MEIEDRTEVLVRQAIHAAVKQDFAKLDETLRAVPDDRTAKGAVELALSVIIVVLTDVHGGKPGESEVRAVAAEIVEDERWADVRQDDVETFLDHLVEGKPLAEVMSPERIFILAFVCAGSLLSANRRDDEKWWKYLDRVEAAIEAAG